MSEVPEKPPALAPDDVQALVLNAHSDLDVVRELLDRDRRSSCLVGLGRGDWETGLSAAAHMGRRDIATFLLDRGARIDVFRRAMLGEVEVVRSMLAAFRRFETPAGRMGFRSSRMPRPAASQRARSWSCWRVRGAAAGR